MRIVERVEGHYDVQDVEFGRVYRWCPERFSVECEVCRKKATYKRKTLLASVVRCECCGADDSARLQVRLREESVPRALEDDEALHPWRYWGGSENGSLPV